MKTPGANPNTERAVWHENPGRRPENRTFRALRDGVFRLSTMRSPTTSDTQKKIITGNLTQVFA